MSREFSRVNCAEGANGWVGLGKKFRAKVRAENFRFKIIWKCKNQIEGSSRVENPKFSFLYHCSFSFSKRKTQGEVKNKTKKKTCLVYNKPRGLATQAPDSAPSVISEWQKKGLFPVGRLDKESEGLLLLTDDGRITTAILGADSKLEKEYTVKVREKLRPGIIAIFAKGMDTETFGKLMPAKAKILSDHTISISIKEGKRHQIRIMLSELNYTVTSLKRVRIGKISLGSLKSGATRPLNDSEIAGLFG